MKDKLIALLKEFKEIFAWSYQDMTGLDTEIVDNRIAVKSKCLLVWQALWRMKSKIILKIKEKVEKQLKVSFLIAITYSDWVANIVPMPKKDGKVHMCVDYKDLNQASSKDNFPLPHEREMEKIKRNKLLFLIVFVKMVFWSLNNVPLKQKSRASHMLLIFI